MTYVNGAIIPVKNTDKETYRKMAADMAALFRKHGALSVLENWGTDVPDGDKTSFAKAVLLQPDERVVFSLIVWPSKLAREQGMAALMSDPAIMEMDNERPFDMSRMIHGGFETIVEA